MSHSCETDVVPFIKHCAFETQESIYNNEFLSKLFMPEAVKGHECDWQDDDFDTTAPIVLNNWEYVEISENFGKRKRLYGDKWTNANDPSISVFLLNESPYNNGGAFLISIVADSAEYIEAFAKDFRDNLTNDFPINELDSAECWG